MTETRKLIAHCPTCETRLVLDVATGEVLSHRNKQQPIAGGKDFDSLLGDLEREKVEAEETFEREMAALKDRDRLLEEKFQEALKQAEQSPQDEPPPRPWDLD